MNPNQALWEKGDFTRIAASMRESGAAVVKAAGIERGMKVLDLGCGDGTTALPAAQLGADVLGVDIASNLVAAGNRRAAEAGLANLRFQEGDASNLEGLPDKAYDRVISIFGAMFAPRPFDVAKEMVRVTKPGGRIVMGNWIPNDPTLVAQILKTSAAYSPPPPEGFVSPMTWGVESHVIERFGAAGIPKDDIRVRPRHLPLRVPRRAVRLRRRIPSLLRADHERLRRGREERPQRRAEAGARHAVREPEYEQRPGRSVDSGDVSSGDGTGGVAGVGGLEYWHFRRVECAVNRVRGN